MRRKRAVCGGADHRSGGPKSKVSDLDFVQKFLSRGISHHIWRELVTKPRHLAFGVLPCVVDRNPAHFLEAKRAAEMAKELRRAVCLQPRRLRLGLSIEDRA